MPTENTKAPRAPIVQNSRFLSLPGELRNRIYEFHLTPNVGNMNNIRFLGLEYWLDIRSFANTCQQIREEYWPLRIEQSMPRYYIKIEKLDSFLKAHFAVEDADGRQCVRVGQRNTLHLTVVYYCYIYPGAGAIDSAPYAQQYTIDIKNLLDTMSLFPDLDLTFTCFVINPKYSGIAIIINNLIRKHKLGELDMAMLEGFSSIILRHDDFDGYCHKWSLIFVREYVAKRQRRKAKNIAKELGIASAGHSFVLLVGVKDKNHAAEGCDASMVVWQRNDDGRRG
ncbi:hypothetical protein P280DRAFT_530790 [Massarina eburnea CBS 473.64]|uniref:F-box domain-containing protein n=1 Tax=Massarina eburnea CBS 473.64 TaxID=1395130 RepID=A0A6A6RPT8_9PLEO|nr:hypothetical protein P280DRAFT_530790 [Massarina eburnea CBS 473.64]